MTFHIGNYATPIRSMFKAQTGTIQFDFHPLNVSRVVGTDSLAFFYIFQDFTDLARRPDRNGKPLVHLG